MRNLENKLYHEIKRVELESQSVITRLVSEVSILRNEKDAKLKQDQDVKPISSAIVAQNDLLHSQVLLLQEEVQVLYDNQAQLRGIIKAGGLLGGAFPWIPNTGANIWRLVWSLQEAHLEGGPQDSQHRLQHLVAHTRLGGGIPKIPNTGSNIWLHMQDWEGVFPRFPTQAPTSGCTCKIGRGYSQDSQHRLQHLVAHARLGGGIPKIPNTGTNIWLHMQDWDIPKIPNTGANIG
eukprot:gene16746-23018_t